MYDSGGSLQIQALRWFCRTVRLMIAMVTTNTNFMVSCKSMYSFNKSINPKQKTTILSSQRRQMVWAPIQYTDVIRFSIKTFIRSSYLHHRISYTGEIIDGIFILNQPPGYNQCKASPGSKLNRVQGSFLVCAQPITDGVTL